MSSDLKDARWELARRNAAEVGLDFFDLDYDTKAEFLLDAQEQLETEPVRWIVKLAEAWRDGE